MKKLYLFIAIIIVLVSCQTDNKQSEYVLVIQGGAGYGTKKDLSPEREQAYIETLTKVLETGAEILKNNGSSLDAVEASIRIMEDSPLFNAGKGAVFNEKGGNEMDASIMDGKDLNAGAVACVRKIRNPISAARKVMTDSKHVLLVKEGAEEFAEKQGLEMADSSYFFEQHRWDYFQKIKMKKTESFSDKSKKYSTVGAVALDKSGNLAAGTSTGGMTNKMDGRVGDSPIIGAGTYANNNTCAVSATGHGEYIIRNVVAYDISSLMEYKGWTLEKAAGFVIMDKLKKINGGGGVIALDKDGNIAMTFNTKSMIRGYITSDGRMEIIIFEE